MFSIGEFAKLGQVSVRMLRHYDAIGLLPSAAVDPASGYRTYRAGQLGRLNRIIALKDLGFSLQQVQVMLDDRIAAAELRGMLRLRRGASPRPGHGFSIVDLPAISSAATIIHRGPMDDVMHSLQVLARWIEDHGFRTAGYHPEVYLEYCPDEPAKGVTEIQVTVEGR